MLRGGACGFALVCVGVLVPATALAEEVCGTVADFNAAMAAAGTSATDVTLTFDVVGINPNDFFGGKGSIAQMRNTACATGQDAVIKVYGPDDPPNTSHPSGTLKMEYGNSCCGQAECGEHWADPNASATIFVDGTEQCAVTMWINPTEVGYSLACGTVGTFDALGENPVQNQVDQIALLEYFLPDGGTTWEMPNATAMNDEVCWEQVESPGDSITVPVLEDVTAAIEPPDAVFGDVTDLAVEAAYADAYLKFEVPPIEGKITRTRLFMHTSTAPSSDGDGGEVHLLTDNDWSEATMTWNTRPGYEAASLGRIGPAAADLLVSLDLGTAVDGPGTWGFAVVSPPTDGNGTHFWSKEGSATGAAYLAIDFVVMDVDGDGTPDGPDCDDADPDVGPDAEEQCNGIDDDCDGDTDEGCDTAGDGSSGATDGGSDGGGFDSGGSDDGPGLPTGGVQRGADTACGCTTSRDASGWLLALAGLALARRRRHSP
jgi:MYXO-CTERM domain-containing protein